MTAPPPEHSLTHAPRAQGMFDVWVEAASLAELVAAVAACPHATKGAYIGPDASFRINLAAIGFK